MQAVPMSIHIYLKVKYCVLWREAVCFDCLQNITVSHPREQ